MESPRRSRRTVREADVDETATKVKEDGRSRRTDADEEEGDGRDEEEGDVEEDMFQEEVMLVYTTVAPLPTPLLFSGRGGVELKAFCCLGSENCG